MNVITDFNESIIEQIRENIIKNGVRRQIFDYQGKRFEYEWKYVGQSTVDVSVKLEGKEIWWTCFDITQYISGVIAEDICGVIKDCIED